MGERRGSIGFFSTYRPPVPLDLYSCPIQPTISPHEEVHLTDGKSYNYNGQNIPRNALKAIIKVIKQHPTLKTQATPTDVDSGRVSGLIFVSERHESLEILHISLRFTTSTTSHNQLEVFSFSEVYGTFDAPRLEDSPCFAGADGMYLVYVSTKDDPGVRREPWNAVFMTHLVTRITHRLTPPGVADFSPSVSPSGRKIAVATLQPKEDKWDGEIEDLKTGIVVMDVDSPDTRMFVIQNGGWPTWGSENVLFFHRRTGQDPNTFKWGVFRADIDHINGGSASNIIQVSPVDSDAMTPVALNATTVAMAIIHKRLKLDSSADHVDNFRHIEIHYLSQTGTKLVKVTQMINGMTDHYNPFIITDSRGRQSIGYHRCNRELLKAGDVSKDFNKVKSPESEVGLFRVSGVFPTFSQDGKKMAFVDNKFKSLWLADGNGLRSIYMAEGEDGVFCPVWNQKKDILYFCRGASFHPKDPVHICALIDASSATQQFKWLTNRKQKFNNAFPSTNSEGTRLVFRSTRATEKDDKEIYKNLYIMDAEEGEFGFGRRTFKRLTQGKWTDSHCQWSPVGNWIVFTSNRLLDTDFQPREEQRPGLPDAGYFSIFLVNTDKPEVQIRVIGSGHEMDDVPGHVCHPFFSPDGGSIVFTSDLAGVSVEPISLPLVAHSVRPYGDIFSVDIDMDYIEKNENVKKFHRITHSRFENSTPSWTMFSTRDPVAAWNSIVDKAHKADTRAPHCPLANLYGFQNWDRIGPIIIPRHCR